MPIYLVKTPQGNKLVDAKSKAQAINHVIRKTIHAEAVTASMAVALMQQGIVVEVAKEEAITEEPTTPSKEKQKPKQEVAEQA